MRENRTSGTVRGALGNRRSYREIFANTIFNLNLFPKMVILLFMDALTLKCQNQTSQTLKGVTLLAKLLACEAKSKAMYLSAARIFFRTFRLYQVANRSIRTTRKALAACDKQCENCDCMKEIYEPVKNVRDAYGELLKLFQTSRLSYNFSQAIIEKVLVDWDDLAEDCLVSSDPEIRASIHRIAKLC